MAQRIKRPFLLLLAMGGCLLPSLFVCLPAKADTIFLKNGKELKGLVVERHADRVILSTEKGEMPVFLKTIKNIKYDDRAQSFFQIGMAYEKEARLGEAMAYYLKALDENPDLPEVRSALQGVRSRFYASTTEGPREEMEKQQILHDSWTKSQPIGDLIQKRRQEHAKLLRDGLGLALEKKGDWVVLFSVHMTTRGVFGG
jgi:tetratricopeptide (TPR) repeat protein